MERHPSSGYPVHPDIRDGHRKDDYIRTYFPLITNGEVFESTQEFGYYCQLPDLDTTEPTRKYYLLHFRWIKRTGSNC